MTPSRSWAQWDGNGYPSEKLNPTIYYYPGIIDIEEPENIQDLIVEIHQDGIAPTKVSARNLLDSAIVVHGQVVDIDGELHCYFGPKYGVDEGGYEVTHEATWVELDEYVE